MEFKQLYRNLGAQARENWTDILLWAIVIVLMLPFIVYAVPQAVGAKDALVVRSGSMEPAIPTASVILITDAQPESLKVGDIITYRTGTDFDGNPIYTTHRIIGIDRTEAGTVFETKGDNNEDPDPWTVEEDDLVGKHVLTVPELGRAIVWLGSDRAFMALVIIPAVALIISEVWNIGKEMYKMRDEGDHNQMFGTVAIIFSFLVIMVAAGAYTGFFGEMSAASGLEMSSSTMTALVLMFLMLISAVALRFV